MMRRVKDVKYILNEEQCWYEQIVPTDPSRFICHGWWVFELGLEEHWRLLIVRQTLLVLNWTVVIGVVQPQGLQ